MEWSSWCRHFLEAMMGQDAGEARHPGLSGDRDEREREQARFEAETRHVHFPPDRSASTSADAPSQEHPPRPVN